MVLMLIIFLSVPGDRIPYLKMHWVEREICERAARDIYNTPDSRVYCIGVNYGRLLGSSTGRPYRVSDRYRTFTSTDDSRGGQSTAALASRLLDYPIRGRDVLSASIFK